MPLMLCIALFETFPPFKMKPLLMQWRSSGRMLSLLPLVTYVCVTFSPAFYLLIFIFLFLFY